jgi:hypothetical protein
LPEDEWLTLARALLARGETRLALRAFYLSALAHLGRQQLIAVARAKSNRDYQRELRRRTRDQPEIQDVFGRLIARFERVWYGRAAADAATLDDFQADRALLLSRTGKPAPAGDGSPPILPAAAT